jgi:hypothetical protein
MLVQKIHKAFEMRKSFLTLKGRMRESYGLGAK